MAKKKFKETASNPFDEGLSMEAADAALYGGELGLDLPDSKKPYPTDIMLLKADRAQPRQVFPLSIRGDWDGGAKAVYDLLEQWRMRAEDELGTSIKILDVLQGRTEGIDVDPKTQPLADEFVQLLNLATGILREGLLNPILIYRTGKGGRIIAGERRWLAHHVLNFYLPRDDSQKWAQIAAFDSQPNVWAQAQENGNRSPLNAIEMARQLALLIMDMYEGDDGVKFDSYDALVSAGSDRRFYAQVADGKSYPIKRGFGDKVLEATGLKSRRQVQRYRDLLNLDDKNWRMADEHNWTEGRCRRILHPEQFIKKEVDVSPNGDITPNDVPPAPVIEKPLEGRDLGVGEGYSQRYEPIVDKSEDWLLPSEMGEMPTDDELAEEQVLVEEAIWDIEIDDTVTGYREPDRPIDERINMNRPPRQTEFDDHGQLRLPHTDSGDQVSFISMRGELRWLLSRVEDMARYQDMKKEFDALRRVTLWTPETIRKKMTEGGRDAVDKEKKQVEDAITRVFNAMFIQFDGLLQDVEDIADQCE